ncbi:DUF4139 domain-containing protein [Streptomyces sp. NPDC021020]|uniref:DUF4139 domain-containing protein n=1 Tax=Streptomyces sp. NPDC021020 TaxID=3365109 RepID=UPI0037A5104A
MGAGTHERAAAGPTVPSEVTSVVVYAAGAVCTRRARVTLPPGGGPVTVRVTGLSPALLEQSLRCRVTADEELRVADIRVGYGATLRRGDELPRLRLDLEDAEDRQSRLREATERLRTEIAETAALRAEPPAPRRGDPPRWAPVESILALASFVDARLTTLHRRLRAAEQDQRQADHAVDVLHHRLSEASTAVDPASTTPSATAYVTLTRGVAEEGAGDGGLDVVLDVEYQVPGACWVPVYQLRLDGRSGAGGLVLRAMVAQRTGEDWTGVRLALSTADLLRRTDLPELRSLRIGRRQAPPAGQSWREPPAGLGELFAGYDAARRPAAPVPVPASAGAGYGFAAEAADDDFADADLAFGGGPPLPVSATPPPPPAPGGPPRPMSPAAAPMARSKASRGFAASAPQAQPTPPPPGTAAPGADLLDYARLTLAGPESAGEHRGTLQPPSPALGAVGGEYRSRADRVAGLARPAHAVDVRTSAGSFDYRFDTAAPADVAADGRWHTVPVGEVPVDADFVYVCVPSVDPAVFSTVRLTNTSSHALLAGPVDVLVDGDFVLTAPLPTLAPGQRQSVGLGVAESVKAARRTHMRESTAGLRGGTTVLDHTVEIDVANRLPYPVAVHVRERVPVSADKDVRIDEHRASPPWEAATAPLEGQEDGWAAGVRTWRVELEPGSTATLSGGYAVRLPAGKAVVGGNRRN